MTLMLRINTDQKIRENPSHPRPDLFPLHGWVGAAVIVAAEISLFAGSHFAGVWFTPIVWTGYILFIDGLVFRKSGESLLTTRWKELLWMLLISVFWWYVFEFYNDPRFWIASHKIWWHYHNLVENPWLRAFGYGWAFATIFPSLFETAELLELTWFAHWRLSRPVRLSRRVQWSLVAIGAVMAVLPLVHVSIWYAPFVWLAYIFLCDPINAMLGNRSIIGDIEQGRTRRLLSLLVSGLICGVLWEFWNYWAISRWTYTVPYFGSVKIFEMPVLGYFGFPLFVVECFALYHLTRGIVKRQA